MKLELLSPWTAGVGGLLVYLGIVKLRRYANVRFLERKFAHLVADPSKMTYPEATEIQQVSILYESPWLAKMALEFALFQTYAIPTISSLLHHTQRLVCPSLYGKRGEDTGVLLLELTVNGIDSERGSLALSRINYIHSRYGSKISRDDMLFTLSLFIYEPLRIIDEHDWRKTTPLEKQARFVFWREVGARMGIADIPKTSEELQAWCEEFERRNMVHSKTNTPVGDATLDLFLRPYPRILRAQIRQALIVLVPDRVREAFAWPRAHPAWLYTFVPGVLALRAFLIRNLFLPRLTPADSGLADPKLTHTDAKGNVYHQRTDWFFEPLYTKPSLSTSLWALLGHPIPGPKYRPEGYTLPSTGPSDMETLGVEQVKSDAEMMRAKAQGGACPFAH